MTANYVGGQRATMTPGEARLVNERYRLLAPLGRGGEATTWLARDEHQEARRVVFKVLRSGEEPAALERLRGEFGRLSAGLHPSLPRAFELDQIRSGPLPRSAWFLTEEVVEGMEAARAFDAMPEPLRCDALLELVADVADALAALHGLGLAHGDVTPANVLLAGEEGTRGRRARLVDFGLCAAPRPGRVAGTPAYMAPEALVGEPELASDLYGLGAVVYTLCAGAPPFGAGDTGQVVERILSGAPGSPCAGGRCAWLRPPVEALALRLLSRDPHRRAASSRALADEARALRSWLSVGGPGGASVGSVPPPGGVALAPLPFVGRERQRGELVELFRQLGERRSPVRLVVLVGAPGSGRTRLWEEARRQHQLRAAASQVLPVEFRGLAQRPLRRAELDLDGASSSPGSSPSSSPGSLIGRAAHRILRELADAGREPPPPPIALLLPREAPALALALARTALAGEQDGGDLLLVGEDAEDAPLARLADASPLARPILLDSLSAVESRSLIDAALGRGAEAELVAGIVGLADGSPAMLGDLLRAARLARPEDPGRASLIELAPGEAALRLLRRHLADLSEQDRKVLAALAAAGGSLDVHGVAAASGLPPEECRAACELLAGRGLLRQEGPAVSAAWLAPARLCYDALAEGERKALHARLASIAGSDAERARHALAAELPGSAAGALAAARAARSRFALEEAVGLLDGVRRAGTRSEVERAALEIAEIEIVRARYEAAGAAAREAMRAAEPTLRRRAVLARALAAQRSGAYEEALRALEALSSPDEETVAGAEIERALVLRARVLLALGRFTEAAEAASGAALPSQAELSCADDEARRTAHARLEVLALARFYLGEAAAAEETFARLARAATEAGDDVLLARAESLLGLAAHARGALVEAERRHQACREAARRAGEVHAAAVAAANLAALAAERSDLGAALAAGAEAVRGLRALGETSGLCAALLNRGRVLLALADPAAARAVCKEVEGLAEESGARAMRGHAAMLRAEIASWAPGWDRPCPSADAERAYDEARRIFASAGMAREESEAWLGTAELRAAAADADAATNALARAEALAPPEVAARLALARARVAAASGVATREAADLLDRALEGARRADRLEELVHGEGLLARLRARAGEVERARAAWARAREAWRRFMDRVPDVYRPALAAGEPPAPADPPAAPVADPGTVDAAPPAVTSEAPEGARLRRLLDVNKRLNSELRLPFLLEYIIDSAVELTRAERGFLLLAGDDRVLRVEVARNIERESLASDELALSRSIAERSAVAAEPILTIDAAQDERFGAARSVADLRLRSVLAAPLRVKGRSVGALYLDHRLRRGAFDARDATLLVDLCDQAAIAIENARLLSENRRRAREVAELNRKLADKVRQRESELTAVRAELRESRGALAAHGDFCGLVGRSPAMQALYRLVDRLVETALPVVLYGESGTGKELLARALHALGPRRERPFIAENCGAIPETLLESVLFGHVRGAFTGADRERRGLFEVADGGTLFLDEVGEMSPAMQTKLLRVLQEGELRRVGGEAVRKVDVRVLCASNRDLAKLVAGGRFREDLFYRLNVVRLDVPPLRERVEDIPPLVDHFLAKHGGGRRRSIDREALARLVAHRWPGNVRELENEIMRALALGGDVIGAGDLSPAIAALAGAEAGDLAPLSPEQGLRLRLRVERLERQLLRQALEQSRGNQTRAAHLLGLSRYGLQKKLHRYGMSV